MTSLNDAGGNQPAEDALSRQSEAQAAQIERLRRTLASVERQRDRLGALLVDCEQQLAVAVSRLAPESERAARWEAEAAQLRADADLLQESADELRRVRATKSWRSTKPLRLVRSRFPIGRDT